MKLIERYVDVDFVVNACAKNAANVVKSYLKSNDFKDRIDRMIAKHTAKTLD